jgi:hypothetical protein
LFPFLLLAFLVHSALFVLLPHHIVQLLPVEVF